MIAIMLLQTKIIKSFRKLIIDIFGPNLGKCSNYGKTTYQNKLLCLACDKKNVKIARKIK